MKKAVKLGVGEAIVYCARGDSKAELGKHKEALADYDQAIRLEPSDEIYREKRQRIQKKLDSQRLL